MGRTVAYAYEHSLYHGVEGVANAYRRRRAADYRSRSQDPSPLHFLTYLNLVFLFSLAFARRFICFICYVNFFFRLRFPVIRHVPFVFEVFHMACF